MGDKRRITHDFSDGTLERIMRDVDTGRANAKGNWFMDHPAYYKTSIQQKDPRKKSPCAACAYFTEPQPGRKKACTFPWKDPQDYALAAFEYLPCQEANK